MADRGMVARDVLRRAHLGFVDAYRVLGRAYPGGAVAEQEGTTCVASGLPMASFNRLFVVDSPPGPEAVIARAREFFAERGLPWSIVAAPEAAEAIAGAARRARLERLPAIPGMLLWPLQCREANVPGFEIRVVDDPQLAKDFIETASAAFSSPRAIFEVFCDAAVLADPDITLYVGYAAGVPVATATRVTTRRIAGVYNIATLQGHRGRGYGEAMTARAALGGLAEGCLASSLQATRMGFPVYERMGFRHVTDYQLWEA